jgi:hypothetical protein
MPVTSFGLVLAVQFVASYPRYTASHGEIALRRRQWESSFSLEHVVSISIPILYVATIVPPYYPGTRINLTLIGIVLGITLMNAFLGEVVYYLSWAERHATKSGFQSALTAQVALYQVRVPPARNQTTARKIS